MNLQKTISSFFGALGGFGKESFAVIILATGIVFCCKGLINGAQFVDLVKSTGIAYLASHTVNSTWGNTGGGEVKVDNPDGP